jgi:hypothetical protein
MTVVVSQEQVSVDQIIVLVFHAGISVNQEPSRIGNKTVVGSQEQRRVSIIVLGFNGGTLVQQQASHLHIPKHHGWSCTVVFHHHHHSGDHLCPTWAGPTLDGHGRWQSATV